MNCDRIARWYRWLEYASFGRALERRRSAFLGEISSARRVLVLGDGDGRALSRLLRRSPFASVDAVDSSSRMLQLALERCGMGRVTFHHADARTIVLPEAEYDLIVTHFFLDCFGGDEMDRLLARVCRAARPGARWLVSEFRTSTAWATLIVRCLYLFFRLTTGLQVTRLEDHRPRFLRYGFQLMREESSWGGLLVSELWKREAGSESGAEPAGNAAVHAFSGNLPAFTSSDSYEVVYTA